MIDQRVKLWVDAVQLNGGGLPRNSERFSTTAESLKQPVSDCPTNDPFKRPFMPRRDCKTIRPEQLRPEQYGAVIDSVRLTNFAATGFARGLDRTNVWSQSNPWIKT